MSTIARTIQIDDDGSGTIGTIFNNAWKQELYGQIDALPYTVIMRTDTGTVNNWAPGLQGHTVILWSGAGTLTVNTMTAGVAGQRVTIRNIGNSVAYFAHGIGADTTVFFLNFAASAPTPIAPQTGAVTYQHDGIAWRMVAHEQGAWITPAFSAANFTGAGGTWTVDAADVVVYSYYLRGRQLTLAVAIATSSMTAGQELGVKIPDGFVCGYAGFLFQLGYIVDNGTRRLAELYAASGGTTLQARPFDLGSLVASTNNTQLQAVVILAVQ